ncbi:MAG: DUF58 domain-containing protein [Deltaproteobacteria bacterium]|nr:DUF58 domain-containing protein [Deltaproteobacteria bacterium]
MPKQPSPLDPEVLRHLKGLNVQAQRVVEGVLAGLHRSPRHGTSIEFAEHKDYSPGDDPRHLDWRVLGRLDRYTVKKYEEETHLRATLAVDLSGSMAYRSRSLSKAQYAAILAASLAALILKQGDAAGMILTSGSQPARIAPRAKTEHLGELVTALEASQAEGPTRLREVALQYMEQNPKRGMLVLFSDLFDEDPEMLASLKMVAARGHQVVVFQVLDPDELEFPFEDPAIFESMEDDRQILTFPHEIKRAYLDEMTEFLSHTKRALAEGRMAYQLARTDEPLHQPLLRHLTAPKAR